MIKNENELIDNAHRESTKFLAQLIMELITEYPGMLTAIGPGPLVNYFSRAYKQGMEDTMEFLDKAMESVSEDSKDPNETINTITGYHD